MRSEREESYEPYRLYRKIANATKTAVMIQRTILLLLLLFSSAIAVKYTTPAKEVQVRFKLPRDCRLGSRGRLGWSCALVAGEFDDLADVDRLDSEA